MAEIAGLSAGIISLASLFSNCVDAFAYVKAGQSLERDFEILLVKLDVEKTRLFSWGNVVGIARALNNGRHAILDDPATEATIRSVLESIRLLLTDSERLQRKYAVEELSEPAAQIATDIRQQNLISGTSLSIFRRSYKRLCNRARHQPQIGITKRVSWAIRDREKFNKLIGDLRGFVDGLVDLAPIAIQSAVERAIEDDVSSLRVEDLNLVEEALSSQGRYQALSDAVSDAIQAKIEGGTIDQWLNNQEVEYEQASQQSQPEPRPDPTPAKTPRNLPRLPERFNCFLMLTSQCTSTVNSELPCIRPEGAWHLQIGQLFTSRSMLAPVEKSWHLSRRIASHITLEDVSNIDLETLTKLRLGLHQRLLGISETGSDVSSDHSDLFHVATIFIYCPPCTCLVDTAVDMCQNMPEPQLLKCLIRIDDRLPCSCFEQPSALEALSLIMKEIRQVESGFPRITASYLRRSRAGYVDRDFLESRIWELETERALPLPATPEDNLERIFQNHRYLDNQAGLVILGEHQCLEPLMRALAVRLETRLPRENEVYWLRCISRALDHHWTHGKICDFTIQRQMQALR